MMLTSVCNQEKRLEAAGCRGEGEEGSWQEGGGGGGGGVKLRKLALEHTWRERLALRNDKRWEVCCQLLLGQLNA